MKLISLLLGNSWIGVFFAGISGLVSGASTAGLIAIINSILKKPELSTNTLGWEFIGICCLLLVSTTLSQALIARLAQNIVFKLQLRLTHQILACPLRQLEEIGTPRLLATLTEDVEAISAASFAVANLGVGVAILICCFLYLSWLSPGLFSLIVLFSVLGVLSQNFLLVKGRYFLKLARQEWDRLFEHFRTITEGVKELKLHQQRRQAFLIEDLQATATVFEDYRIRAIDLFAIAGGFGILLFFIPIGLLIFIFYPLFKIPSSVVTSYVITIIFMMTPLRVLLSNLPLFGQASVAIEKIESLGLSLAAHTTELESINSLPEQNEWKSLKLQKVTHAYRREQKDNYFILGPLNVTFYRGELVFLIGGNGSGKSTLIKLLAGLYVAESGEILLDEQPITEANREWYRQKFSVVFSDFYIFDRLLGLDKSHFDNQTQYYLHQLQLNGKVKVKQGIFSTTVLSQGQRKRLALLTAYIENRDIYIFDEWASDQDPLFKKVFYTQILPDLKKKDKTVFVISHDDQYFAQADRIIKLDNGQITAFL